MSKPAGYFCFGVRLGLMLTIFPLLSPPVLAQSITPSPESTGTIVTRDGNRYDISGGQRSQDDANLFHQFEQFGLTQDEIARFLSSPEIRNILATVDGGDISIINGLLQISGGNSNLYLINPAGIVFGADAQLDLPASFFANTANGVQFGDRLFDLFGTPDFAALIGDPTGFTFSALEPGILFNAGNLEVADGYSLGLMGGVVVNTGTLIAPDGQITIAAIPGDTHVRISQEGTLLSLEVPQESLVALQSNPATLPELLTGSSLPELPVVIEADGTVRLVNAETVIPTETGVAIASGNLDASGETGGAIDVLGDRVGLVAATLNADGTDGGGSIRIGGDYQGNGTIPNAERTYVSANSILSANALTTGNGGRIIIWADDTTAYYGTLSATGGTLSGNGGFAEVSGSQNLGYYGTANLSATNGTPGTLLLDPENIVIVPNTFVQPGDANLPNILGTDPPNPGILFLSEAALRNSAAAQNLFLQATNTIQIASPTPNAETIDLGVPGTTSITFLAGNAFVMAPEDFFLTQGRNLLINAPTITAGTLGSNDGPVDGLPGGRAGNIILESTGNITVTAIFARSNTAVNQGVGSGTGGSIIVNAGGDFVVTGSEPDGVAGANNPVSIRTSGLQGTGDPDLNVDGDGITDAIFIRARRITSNQGQISAFVNTDPNSTVLQPGGRVTLIATGGDINVRGLNAESLSLSSPTSVIIGDTFVVSETDLNTRYSLNTRSENLRINAPQLIVPDNSTISAPLLLQNNLIITTPTNTGQIFIIGNIDADSEATTSQLVMPTNLNLRVSIGSTTPISSLQVRGESTINSPLINTTGEQEYIGLVNLNSNVSFSGEATTFNNGIVGQDYALDISGDASFSQDVAIGSLQVTGNTLLTSSDVTTVNAQIYDGAVNLTQDTVLSTADSPIEFRGTVDGSYELTIATGSGNLLFSDAVGGNAALQELSVTTTGNVTFLDALSLRRTLNTSNVALIELAGNVQVGGNMNVTSPILLNEDISIRAGGSLSLREMVRSSGDAYNLTLEALDGTLAVADITTNGGTLNLVSSIGTIVNGTLSTVENTGGGDVRFQSPVLGGQDLLVQAGTGNLFFDAPVGSLTNPLRNFSVDTTGRVNLASGIVLNGLFELGDAAELQLGGDVQTLGSNLVVTSPITLNNDISITAGGSLSLSEAVSSSGDAYNLTLEALNGTLAIADITTNGGILDLTGSTGIAVNGTLSTAGDTGGGDVRFQSPVLGGQSLNIVAGSGNIVFEETIGSPTVPLQSFVADTTGRITLTDGITLNGIFDLGDTVELQLGGDVLASGGDLAIAAPITLIDDASITTAGRLRLSNVVSSPDGANDLVLQSEGGRLSVRRITTNGGNLSLSSSTEIDLNGRLSTVGDNGGGSVQITGSVTGGDDITIRSGTGDVSFDGVLGGDLPIENLSITTTGILTFGDDVTARNLDIGNAGALALGGDVRLLGGDVTVRSPITLIDNASITTDGDLRLTEGVSSPTGANNFALSAGGSALRTQDINTNGGTLSLESQDVIISGNLTTANPDGSGDLRVVTQTQITTGDIDTSAIDGDAGDVLLDPSDDIQVGFINAQSTNSAGGNITATTGSLFRSTNSFVAANGAIASISAIGGTEGGDVTISHFGGAERIPFLVGGSSENGTIAAIVTGTLGDINTILPTQIFPGSYDQFGATGNIRLITQDFPVLNPEPDPLGPLGIPNDPTQVEIERRIFQLEYYFTGLTERYLGITGTPIRTLNEIRSTLRTIERQTGVRPAIIYAFFYPQELSQLQDALPLEIRQNDQADNSNDILHLVLVTAEGEPILVKVPEAIRESALAEVVAFRRALIEGRERPSDRSYGPLAQQLYGWLLAHLEADLQERGIENLVYVMEPGLRSIPLAALHDGNDFAIRRYSIGQMPSVSLTDTTYEDIQGSFVLAGGASEFEEQDPLPGAENEIYSIIQQLWRDAQLFNEDFTRNNLIEAQQEQPHGIVHLATHANFSEGDLSNSYIQLWREQISLNEIREMGWGDDPAVKLLVLSACETASGSLEAELGFGGAAVQTGVESVLASIWKVSDVGTLALMAEFYQQLGLPEVGVKAEALQRAQLALLDGEVSFANGYLEGTDATIFLPNELSAQDNFSPTHPYYWSGFTLIGSPW